MLKQEDEVES
jgi:serine/threonine protein kinase